mgnify:CR=1 FL=1
MKNFEHAGEVLTALMEERGLTAADLSRQTMIDAGILRTIMNGKTKSISTRNVMTLSHYFGMSMAEFIEKVL